MLENNFSAGFLSHWGILCVVSPETIILFVSFLCWSALVICVSELWSKVMNIILSWCSSWKLQLVPPDFSVPLYVCQPCHFNWHRCRITPKNRWLPGFPEKPCNWNFFRVWKVSLNCRISVRSTKIFTKELLGFFRRINPKIQIFPL